MTVKPHIEQYTGDGKKYGVLHVNGEGDRVTAPQAAPKGQSRPARQSGRIRSSATRETIAFANRRDKRRKQCNLAKASRKKNRK